MSDEILYSLDQWLILAAFFALLLLATEGGYRLGRFMKPRTDEAARSVVSNIHAAILGLLGLLLAFTFSMAVTRYETRKQLVLDEADAIGTAYLRARLLPEPQRTEVAGLFQEYVDARMRFHQDGETPDGRRDANGKADRLQDQLWARAVAAGEADPRSVTTGLFIQALNDVIDVRAKRLTATENHVPEPVLFFLILFAALAVAAVGYGCGLCGGRNFFSTLTFAVLIALATLVILDLDRPRRGLIRVSQKPMIELRDSLKTVP